MATKSEVKEGKKKMATKLQDVISNLEKDGLPKDSNKISQALYEECLEIFGYESETPQADAWRLAFVKPFGIKEITAKYIALIALEIKDQKTIFPYWR